MKKVSAGLSITLQRFELSIFSEKKNAIDDCAIIAPPPGLFDASGDKIVNPELLKVTLEQLFSAVGKKPREVNLSLPAALLRLSEIPKLESSQMFLSLSSEAERYKQFEGTEAAIDYFIADNIPASQSTAMQVVLGGVRQDTLEIFIKTLRSMGIKAVNIDIEPLCSLRGMAASGVLDSLLDQIGDNSVWGIIFSDPGRVRFALWQGQELLELRETSMDTSAFNDPESNPFLVEDMLEEARRTTKNWQPAIWLHENLPYAVSNGMETGLGIPVRPSPKGTAITLSNPDLSLAGIGAALISIVAFPFCFNIPPNPSKQAEQNEESDSNTPELLIGTGGVLLVLALLATGLLFILNLLMFQPAVQEKQNQKTQMENQIAALEQEKIQLSTSGSLKQGLAYTAQRAKMRGQMYVNLVQALRRSIPSKLWIQDLSAGDTLSVHGKAISHQDILNFSKIFDMEPYVTQSSIQTIQEERLAGKALFDYLFNGTLDITSVDMPTEETVEADLEEIESDESAESDI